MRWNRLLYLCLISFTLYSCEQVIDVDLQSAPSRYVIEGTVTNSEIPHQIMITRSKPFNENNEFEGVSGAEVVLSDNRGNRERLVYADSGLYLGDRLPGIPGRTYSLSVSVGEETFTASSTMPAPVGFDHLLMDSLSLFGETYTIPYALYEDPEGVENYYRHVLYVNRQKSNSIFVSSDERYDGSYMERALRVREPDDLSAGDTVSVVMQTIDQPVYEYFSTLSQTIYRSAATPANPASNLSGNALGYFSAHTVQIRSTIVRAKQ